MKHNWPEWIDSIGRDDVSEDELRTFQDALNESPENMKEYIHALMTESTLEMETPLAAPQIPAQPSAPVAVNTTPLPSRQTFMAKRWPLPIAACLAGLLGLSYFFTRENTITPLPTETSVATITDTNKSADASGLRIGALVNEGELNIPDGAKIGLAMRGGARLDINGPATLRIDGPDKVFLLKGRVKTYAPEYAHGFAINTDEGKIIDLGTRFVTSTGTDLGTEIHVIEGLVKAKATDDKKTSFIGGKQAAILKDGKMSGTDYLAQRLNIPLDPNLVDTDGDGAPDVIEEHYGTNANDPKSKPEPLRIAESFKSYTAGPIGNSAYQGTGNIQHWQGSGNFQTEGLNYSNNGKILLTSGGCIQSTGIKGAGAVIIPDSKELPSDGIIYISFLMQQPANSHKSPYAGLLLYLKDYKEQFFCGEVSVANSYGSRLAKKNTQDSFAIPTDDKPHLFVIRIDQTRFLTDVYIDPPLGGIDKEKRPEKRYQNVPNFDRIIVRSGSNSGNFPVRFDEIRVGLTWESVLPLAP